MSHQHAPAGHKDESSALTGRTDILARNSKRNYRPPFRPVPITVHVRPLREPLTVLTPLRHAGASEDGKIVPRLTLRRRGAQVFLHLFLTSAQVRGQNFSHLPSIENTIPRQSRP